MYDHLGRVFIRTPEYLPHHRQPQIEYRAHDGPLQRQAIQIVGSRFRELSEPEKERYVAFGEWEGRSGGYAIQTLGSTLVERIEGSVSNVVGLPVGLLAEMAPELLQRG